jgi:photosystem II stability/assembly factor-like uncharacterized protein
MRAPRIATLAAAALAATALASAGCAAGSSTLTLDVGAASQIDGVDHLAIVFTEAAGGRSSAPATVALGGASIPPAHTSIFALPSSVKGVVRVTATAFDGTGATLLVGSVDVSVQPSKSIHATLTLGVQASGAPPDPDQSTVTVDRTSGVVANGADAVTVTVTLKDSAGAPLSGATVVLSASGDGGSFSTPLPTDVDGVTTSSFTSTKAETKTITAVANGVTLTQMPTVDFIPGAVAQLHFVEQPANGVTNTPLAEITVAVSDAQGNPVPTATNEITLALAANPGGANLLGTPTAAAAAGVASFTLVGLDKPGRGYTLSASASNVTTATSGTFDVTPPPFQLVSTGIFGGSANSIVVSPAPAGGAPTIFVALPSGVYKSTNAGSTWSAASFGFDGDAGTLVADPKNPGVVWAVASGPGGGVSGGSSYFAMKTTNNGAGWFETRPAGSTSAGEGASVAVDPMNPSIVYVASGHPWRSTTGGATWTEQTTFPFECDLLTIDPITTSTLYCSTYDRTGMAWKGVYKTVDSGASWAPVNNGLASLEARDLILATPNAVFVESDSILYRSTNGGGNWTSTGINFPYSLAYAPSNPMRMYLSEGASGIAVSNDGGASFGSPVSIGDVVQSIAVDPTNPDLVFAAGRDNGVYVSTNGGGSWSFSSTGIATRGISSVVMDPGDANTVLVSTGPTIFKTADGGTSWTTVSTMAGGVMRFDPTVAGKVYSCNATFYTSTNRGTTWVAGGVIGNGCTELQTKGTTVYAAGYPGGARKSTNSGDTWGATSLADSYTYSVAIGDATGAAVNIGSNMGLYHSADSGGTFTMVTTDLVESLLQDPITLTRVIAGLECGGSSNGGFRVSTDGGATWGAAAIGPCVSRLATNGTNLYAAGRPYSAFSTDHGATWAPIGGGIPTSVEAKTIAASGDGKIVYIGTTNGLFKSTSGGL